MTISQEHINLRDRMHKFISFACDVAKDSNIAIEICIRKAKESLEVQNDTE